jgi:DNA gyrase subunit A
VPAHIYKAQHRGGKGIIGMVTREEDAVRLLAIADTHDYLLLCTTRGRVFSLKCYEVPPDVSRVAKGLAVVNLFSIPPEEKVSDMVVITNFYPQWGNQEDFARPFYRRPQQRAHRYGC